MPVILTFHFQRCNEMKLTKETLKRIIKEEIDHLMLEQKVAQAAEDVEELLDNPKALKVMDKLDDLAEVIF